MEKHVRPGCGGLVLTAPGAAVPGYYLRDLCGSVVTTYAGRMIRRFPLLYSCCLMVIAVLSVVPVYAAKHRRHGRARRYAVLGAVRTVPYSMAGDPAGALPGETSLRVRPLVVADRIKGWTTGEVHPITPDSFAVQSAVRMDNSLPGDKHLSWVWQRGPWLLVHRDGGRVATLRLPDYDPSISRVVWFRNYAAYCGLSASGEHLYAIVEQMGRRRPVISRELAAWSGNRSAVPACAPPQWQVSPLAVSFTPAGGAATTYDLFSPAAPQPARAVLSTPVAAP